MEETLLRKATEALSRRTIALLAGSICVFILGGVARKYAGGLAVPPSEHKLLLLWIWIVTGAALGLGFVVSVLFDAFVERPRARTALEKRRRVSEHLHMAIQMASELAASLDTPEFQKRLHRFYEFLFYCIPQVLSPGSEIRRLALFVPDDASGKPPKSLRISRACQAFPADYVEGLRLPIEKSIAGRVYRTNTSYRAGRDDPDWYSIPEDPMQNYNTIMCSPVVLGSEVVAVLSIDHSEREAFSGEDQDHFELFARQFALVWALSHPAEKESDANAE